MRRAESLRLTALRFHRIARTRVAGEDAALLHETAAIMEQRADALDVAAAAADRLGARPACGPDRQGEGARPRPAPRQSM